MNTQKSPIPNDGLHWVAQAIAHACLWHYITKKMTPGQMALYHAAIFGLGVTLWNGSTTAGH